MALKQKQCRHCGKKFKLIHKKQEDCSELCLALRFDTFVKRTRKLARIFAATMGYRSISEVRFAAKLKSNRIPFTYEEFKFGYQFPPQKYTVDFSIKNSDGTITHFEYKGKLDAVSRKKLRAIKQSNPDLDLRLVFEKPNNKLYAGAKMRYWEWAVRNGFRWYDATDIPKIRRDLKGTKS